jgi:hypothetical protein
LTDVFARPPIVELPTHYQIGRFLVLFWELIVHRHAFAGNIEVGPDATLVEEEEVAKDISFEDGNRESKISFNYVWTPCEGFFDVIVAAFVGHELNVVASLDCS